MARQLTVRAAQGTHTTNLTASDWKVSSAFPKDRFYTIAGGCYLESEMVARQELLDAARTLLRDVQQQWEVLPFQYSFRTRDGGRGGSSSSTSGFHINGIALTICSRPGQCYLEERAKGPDGMFHVVRTTDVRDKKQIDTDDWGPIKIFRRKLEMRLPEELESLIGFLSEIPDEEVQVRTTEEGEWSVMDLVREAAEGSEGAEEELFNRGESAKQELITLLTDAKARKHIHTIAWILLTVLPSPDSRTAVEQAAEREKDPKRKKSLLTLIVSTPDATTRV